MYLKRLELSGFKSFAKTTVLEFPSRVTAIVGPNGSGKSNLKDAIQWVLGEQSLKTLRGKKGEDLIWNGSAQVPRLGRASVSLVFDNKSGKIPLEFEEVVVARTIFRDGLNEYSLNDSQVRLKDIVELMARLGLGEAKHNIIGQGEVDRILMASPLERRELLEEALGLRVYQLKRDEAERKLETTERNMQQVEGLIRELAPHLKFLRQQAEKAHARETLEQELKMRERVYFAKEEKELKEARQKYETIVLPLQEKHDALRKEISRLTEELMCEEEKLTKLLDQSPRETARSALEAKQRACAHELGRLEGKLESMRESAGRPALRTVDARAVAEEIREFLAEMKTVLEEEDRVEVVRSHLLALMEDIERLLRQIERGVVEEKSDHETLKKIEELEGAVERLRATIAGVSIDLEGYEEERAASREQERAIQLRIREFEGMLRVARDEERDLSLRCERFRFEYERIAGREAEFAAELARSQIPREELSLVDPAEYEAARGEELRRKIERLRSRLEEIGGIAPEVAKEYEETEARHRFLSAELEDLKKASASLKELSKELERHIRKDFREGFAKIKEEFHNYFRVIFGGGKASLQLVSREQPAGEEMAQETSEEYREREEGVEVSVDLPRKRIKGLTMLSGGERALTSIAFLFAITAVSPPPFLVLDETDAALDEANSRRYAAILKELCKKTQLILVTHNRETMKSAGILYGVTMGDEGVSRLLSLKLEEAEMYTNR